MKKTGDFFAKIVVRSGYMKPTFDDDGIMSVIPRHVIYCNMCTNVPPVGYTSTSILFILLAICVHGSPADYVPSLPLHIFENVKRRD